MSFKPHPLALALAALPFAAVAVEETSLSEVVVSAPQMRDPLVVVSDPKAPQVPVPASDGASFLKNIPGFNVVRKGGTDGDPVLRGLAGSRLNVLLDGAEFHGGCGQRMDPPTAYVFPEAYDRVKVVKGPQTVLYGNGNLAGVVLFERDAKPFAASGARGFASLMTGSWGRLDGVADAAAGNRNFSLRASATHSESDDYADGKGRKLHSAFERNSYNLQGGWMPDADTRLELSAVKSDARAAYADRTMDGAVFDREGYGVKFEKQRISALLRKLEVQANYNYIDHVMDNYSLRDKPATAMYMWNNPDRETRGLRASAELALALATTLTVGADRQDNTHTLRSFSGAAPVDVDSRTRGKDLEATTTGLFGELVHELAATERIVAGLRHDRYAADRSNATTGAAMGSANENLRGGFMRYERDLTAQPATLYVGLGHGERPMDHWEATTWNGLTATGKLDPERNTQLDAGLVWSASDLNASLSAYYSRIDDYVLTRATGACNLPGRCTSANVDATRYGLEADLAWRFATRWTLRGSYAFVHADNDSMDVPLAQTPPQELKLGTDYQAGPWTVGILARFVGRQDRVHVGYGTIVGQDIGKSAGFATLAVNGSYRLHQRVLLSAGIDNLFDRTYAEHISRPGSAVGGYDPATIRVNEPGRFVWAKLNLTLD